MEFTIRQASIDDSLAIAHVQVESWRTTYAGIVPDAHLAAMSVTARTGKWREQFLAENSIIFVAEDASGIFGFITGGPSRESIEPYDAELYAIYLLHSQQQHGVGRKLTRTLANHLRAEGFQSMLVWVLEQNPAVSFYKHLGAIQVTQKTVAIGGASLPELALGWKDLDQLSATES